MAENANITVEILPTEQAQLKIELKIYEKLLKIFYENSEIKYNNTYGELELNINNVLQYLVKEIGNLKTELSEYEDKAPISRPTETEQTNE